MSNPIPPRDPRQEFRSTADAKRNAPDLFNPWSAYDDAALEEMARYYGESEQRPEADQQIVEHQPHVGRCPNDTASNRP